MAIFTNQATLSFQNTQTLSNVVTGEILAPLMVTKTAIGNTYRAGDAVAYAVSLVNTGAAPLTGLTVIDDLGAYLFGSGTLVPLDYVEGGARLLVNGVPAADPTPTDVSPLTFSPITVPAGGNVTLLYKATANAYAPIGEGGTIENTVTVTGACPVTASETVTAVGEPLLSIVKGIAPTTVTPGDTVVYTLTVENSGPTPVVATDNATVSDVFDPILADITVTLDGTPLAEGVGYAYDEETGAFTTLPGALPVPAGTVVQDPVSGGFSVIPGTAVLTVTGRVVAEC